MWLCKISDNSGMVLSFIKVELILLVTFFIIIVLGIRVTSDLDLSNQCVGLGKVHLKEAPFIFLTHLRCLRILL